MNTRSHAFSIFIDKQKLLMGNLWINAVSDNQSVEVYKDFGDGFVGQGLPLPTYFHSAPHSISETNNVT